jgi:hypothetical protein
VQRAFTTYFPIPDFAQLGIEGVPVPFMPGGPHSSLPSFRRRKITTGEVVYLIGVRKGILYRVARIVVAEVLSLDAFMERFGENPEDSPGFRAGQSYCASFRTWPLWNFLFTTCTEEILISADSTPLSIDYPVPVEVLSKLQYLGKEGERQIIKTLHDGKITRTGSLQGVYQLTDQSILLLDSLPKTDISF